MSREYIALHKKSDKKIYLKYDYFGVLEEVKFKGERWTEEQIKWFFDGKRNHFTETEILQMCENKTLDFDYQMLPTDLSFSVFWNAYAYKVGGIPNAQKQWNLLSDAEKLEALIYIPKYKQKKKIETTALLYPERYLKGKVWLAEKI
jgi:hypothetical protein